MTADCGRRKRNTEITDAKNKERRDQGIDQRGVSHIVLWVAIALEKKLAQHFPML